MHQKIKTQLKEAMIAKDATRLLAIRGLLAEFTKDLVAKGSNADFLDDASVLTIIKRMVKQRKDSIDQFTKGGRPELAESEMAELKILETYLPETMSLEAVLDFIKTKLDKNTIDKTKSGQLVGQIMKDLSGKADGSVVKLALEEFLK